jgi:UDP-glucose 4-epimerase
MKVFITGIAGFVGSNVANSLNEIGVEVYGVDNLVFGSDENLDKGIRWRRDCIANVTKEELEHFDVLLHMACSNIVFAINDPITTFTTNSHKSIELFEKWGKDKPIVYTGTSSVYGNSEIIPTPETAPIVLTNAYDTSKFITERYLKLRGNYTTLRLSNVYGINQRQYGDIKGVIYGVLHSALSGTPIEINGDGEQTRDFTYISDAVNAIIEAVAQNSKNTEINIGTGRETSINNIAAEAIYINMLYKDEDSEIVYIPRRGNDGINRRCLDVSKAEQILGWKPTTALLTGMMLTAKWMIKQKLVKL